MNVRPIKNKCVIKEDEKEKVSSGGIIIPDNAKDGKFSVTARVVVVGPGKILENGKLLEPELKKGDHVVLPKHHGTEVTLEGETCRIVDMDVIEGVIEDE